jgi:hypothetical protein
MATYSAKFVQELAKLTVLKPTTLEAAAGADALHRSPYLPMLTAFMEPLAGLYRSLRVKNFDFPSDDILNKSAEVSQNIAEQFYKEVSYIRSRRHRRTLNFITCSLMQFRLSPAGTDIPFRPRIFCS